MKLKYINYTFILIVFFLLSACTKQEKLKQLNKYYSIRNNKIIFQDINPRNKNKAIELPQASVKNFKILHDTSINLLHDDSYYAIDKMQVFYKNLTLKGANPNDFQLLRNDFSKDKKQVFFRAKLLIGADAKSFEVLTNYYAKDKNKLWFTNRPVKTKIDLKSFNFIDGYFSKDSTNVYLNNEDSLQIFNANPQMFTKAPKRYDKFNQLIYSNKDNIFILNTDENPNHKNYITTLKSDTTNFKILSKKYYIANNKVYYKSKQLRNTSVKEFKIAITDSSDAKDNKNIYFNGQIVAKRKK